MFTQNVFGGLFVRKYKKGRTNEKGHSLAQNPTIFHSIGPKSTKYQSRIRQMFVQRVNFGIFCAVFTFLLFVQGTFGIGSSDNGTTTISTMSGGGVSQSTTTQMPTTADSSSSIRSRTREKRQQTANQQPMQQQQQQLNLESLPVCASGQSPVAPIPPAGPPLPIGAIPPTVVCLKCRPPNVPLGNGGNSNGN